MKKFILTSIISLFALTTAAVPAFAAASEPKAAGSNVHITAKATEVNVTVPGVLPIVFNANGTETLPTNWTIINNTPVGMVYLSRLSLDAKDSGWVLATSSEDVQSQARDRQRIRLKVGKAGAEKLIEPDNNTEGPTGSVDFAQNEIDFSSGGSQTLNFVAERGAFTFDLPTSNAFRLTLNFNFK